MEKISLQTVLIAAYGIIIAYVYGAVICAALAYRTRKSQQPPTKVQLALLLWPIAVAATSLVIPKSLTLEPTLGAWAAVYSHISFDCCFYVVAAVPAVAVLLFVKKRRWLYAALPFVVAAAIVVVRVLTIIRSVKQN